ncbi:MAG: hypothetical protein Fur0046_37510 [Cyanobacteria bacterium J069]
MGDAGDAAGELGAAGESVGLAAGEAEGLGLGRTLGRGDAATDGAGEAPVITDGSDGKRGVSVCEPEDGSRSDGTAPENSGFKEGAVGEGDGTTVGGEDDGGSTNEDEDRGSGGRLVAL